MKKENIKTDGRRYDEGNTRRMRKKVVAKEIKIK
jgi:hypothetical protein